MLGWVLKRGLESASGAGQNQGMLSLRDVILAAFTNSVPR